MAEASSPNSTILTDPSSCSSSSPSAFTVSSKPTPPSSSPPSPASLPPHLSHNPETNTKISPPFQFGSRYLSPESNIYEFNAWDHVPPPQSWLTHSESQYALQRSSPVSAYDAQRFNSNPEKWWNRFYANNTVNFFKDRKWLVQEFPVLGECMRKGAGKKTVLEVGAGAGNTALPVLRASENEGLEVWACDFSRKAVELLEGTKEYVDPEGSGVKGRLVPRVWDITLPCLPDGLESGSVDVVMLVFIFSALAPTQWKSAIRNVWLALKPGGEVCFRDYGRGDLAQVRFKKGRWLAENFYVRGDGTRVYFFEEEKLRELWGGKFPDTRQDEEHAPKTDIAEEVGVEEDRELPTFNILSLGVDRRLLVNRKKELQMLRCWIQGKFQKSLAAVDAQRATLRHIEEKGRRKTREEKS